MRDLVFHGTLGKFTWRMLATVLGGQSLCLFLGALVARALAASGTIASGVSGTTYLVIGCGLGVLCVVAAGSMRRPWGVSLGWGMQGLMLLSSLVVPTMIVVSVVFLALWVTCMVQGARIDRIDARRAAEAAALEGADRVVE